MCLGMTAFEHRRRVSERLLTDYPLGVLLQNSNKKSIIIKLEYDVYLNLQCIRISNSDDNCNHDLSTEIILRLIVLPHLSVSDTIFTISNGTPCILFSFLIENLFFLIMPYNIIKPFLRC